MGAAKRRDCPALAYLKEPTQENRDEVVDVYLGFAISLINKSKVLNSGPFTSFDDLKSVAVVAMLGALERYDGSVSFISYAGARIAGSLQDYARKVDPIPRRDRVMRKRIEHTRRELEQELGREAMLVEICDAGGFDIADVVHAYSSGHSIDKEYGDSGSTMLDKLAGDPDPHVQLEWDVVRRTIRRLKPKEIKVLTMASRGLTLESIGMRLGLTGARVSQIRSKAIQRLRAADK